MTLSLCGLNMPQRFFNYITANRIHSAVNTITKKNLKEEGLLSTLEAVRIDAQGISRAISASKFLDERHRKLDPARVKYELNVISKDLDAVLKVASSMLMTKSFGRLEMLIMNGQISSLAPSSRAILGSYADLASIKRQIDIHTKSIKLDRSKETAAVDLTLCGQGVPYHFFGSNVSSDRIHRLVSVFEGLSQKALYRISLSAFLDKLIDIDTEADGILRALQGNVFKDINGKTLPLELVKEELQIVVEDLRSIHKNAKEVFDTTDFEVYYGLTALYHDMDGWDMHSLKREIISLKNRIPLYLDDLEKSAKAIENRLNEL